MNGKWFVAIVAAVMICGMSNVLIASNGQRTEIKVEMVADHYEPGDVIHAIVTSSEYADKMTYQLMDYNYEGCLVKGECGPGTSWLIDVPIPVDVVPQTYKLDCKIFDKGAFGEDRRIIRQVLPFTVGDQNIALSVSVDADTYYAGGTIYATVTSPVVVERIKCALKTPVFGSNIVTMESGPGSVWTFPIDIPALMLTSGDYSVNGWVYNEKEEPRGCSVPVGVTIEGVGVFKVTTDRDVYQPGDIITVYFDTLGVGDHVEVILYDGTSGAVIIDEELGTLYDPAQMEIPLWALPGDYLVVVAVLDPDSTWLGDTYTSITIEHPIM